MGPYKEGAQTSEFFGSMTGASSPVISPLLITLMTKLGVAPSETVQIIMLIGSCIVALPSIVYYIKRRLDYKANLISNQAPEDQQLKLMQMLLADPAIKEQLLNSIISKIGKEKS